jgi:hypothetical protein
MPRKPKRQFESFEASELYCPRCRRSQPVRSRLLLVLPTGDLHDYVCRVCGTSVGLKTEGDTERPSLLRPA